MLSLDDDDTFLDPPPSTSIAPPKPHLAQTRCLGAKQFEVRWLPNAGARALAVAGSWDEGDSNELTAWSVSFEAATPDDGMTMEGEEASAEMATKVGAAPHTGDVLGLSVGGLGVGRRPVAFTASGSGGVSCYSVDLADEGAGGAAGGKVGFQPQWTGAAAPIGGLATLGVSYSEVAGGVCAVGEDGVLALLQPESGVCAWKATTREPALFAVEWCTGLGPHLVVTAGATLGLWDMRVRAAAPQSVLAPTPGVATHAAPALLSVSADAQPPYRIAAGASDGAIHVWDVRASAPQSAAGSALAPVRSLVGAHKSDVWDVQMGTGQHGQLLSCANDGTLVAWSSLELHASGAPPAAARQLVEHVLPINKLDLSAEHGILACASDIEVLTFLDMREA